MARNKLPEAEVHERLRVGATVRALRVANRRTADDIANGVGISRPHYTNIEAGRKPLTPELAHRLSVQFGCPLTALVRPGYFEAAA